ncbi:tRNA dimethylallyltransferase [Paraurantiacibacter namhicola]|uniref:tRNA dimethylallyltransferase n=1 Tax=Paraurantiacibacter namhicola TaxID=645517 RepID=A0A1C7D8S6_9SPHN|nr:tRNA dimethylallyltransferase [Paraurantiacibacter namhicola]
MRLGQAWQDRGRRALVINADSAQVYRDLQVLSARPTEAEMGGVTHALFGKWDGATPCSAADWAEAAREAIVRAHASGVLPILVGGTGLYIRTLLDGIAPIPAIAPEIRDAVRSLSVAEAYAALEDEDPERAAALNPADTTRVQRALEVVRSTGKPMAHWQSRREGGIGPNVDLSPLVLMPDREELYARCNARFCRMLDHGAVEEVEALLARDLDPALPVMRAIGVPEIAAWLHGEIQRDEMVMRGQQATRNYAKRQFTWFRRQMPEDWQRVVNEDSRNSLTIERLFPDLLLT